MSKFRKLVENSLKEYAESPSEELDEDFKSGLKGALGTAAVIGGLMLPGMFDNKEEYINRLNAGVEGDLPKVVDCVEHGGRYYLKLEGDESKDDWTDAEDFIKWKDDILHEKEYGHTLSSHDGELLDGETNQKW